MMIITPRGIEIPEWRPAGGSRGWDLYGWDLWDLHGQIGIFSLGW